MKTDNFFYYIHLVNLVHLKVNGRRLYPYDSVNYLGVTFYSNFNFETNIISLCKKSARANGILYKMRNYVSHEIILSLLHSRLSYSINAGQSIPTNACRFSICKKSS